MAKFCRNKKLFFGLLALLSAIVGGGREIIFGSKLGFVVMVDEFVIENVCA